jgi:A/G-specific adenine glycosylase
MTVAARKPARKKATGVVRAIPRRDRKPGPQAADLLAWYDRHRRILPWRARRGETAEPYGVWLSEIMLQQTTVKAVAPYYARFLSRWPAVEDLAKAALDDVLREWAGLGYYARARNLHACAVVVAEKHGGIFPRDEAGLRELPGVGAYTAAAIAAIAYDAPAVPVDGNIERVISRLFAVEDELPKAKPEISRLALSLLPPLRSGDFAQAMMDLGATICTPKKPACVLCPWTGNCAARKRGDQESFPRKTPKRAGDLRRGAAFVVLRGDGAVLVRNRPPRGLLGGMAEVPGSEWSKDFDIGVALTAVPKLGVKAAWQKLRGTVNHVFTHFPLELTVFLARVPQGTKAPAGMRWAAAETLDGEAFPNVMRKVLAHALNGAAKNNDERQAGEPHGRKRTRS